MIALALLIFPASLIVFLALAWNAPLVDENEQPIEASEADGVRRLA